MDPRLIYGATLPRSALYTNMVDGFQVNVLKLKAVTGDFLWPFQHFTFIYMNPKVAITFWLIQPHFLINQTHFYLADSVTTAKVQFKLINRNYQDSSVFWFEEMTVQCSALSAYG